MLSRAIEAWLDEPEAQDRTPPPVAIPNENDRPGGRSQINGIAVALQQIDRGGRGHGDAEPGIAVVAR